MKACWTEPRITFSGRFWQLDDAAMEPKPFQKPHPPLWIGGNHPAAVRRAVRYGDDFFGAGRTRQPRSSPSRCGSFGRHRLSQNKSPATSRSPNASTLPSTTTQPEPMSVWKVRLKRIYGASGLSDIAVYGPPSACERSLMQGPNSSNFTCSSTIPSRWSVWPPKSSHNRVEKAEYCPFW